MLTINDLKPGVNFLWQGKPYEVLKSEHVQMGRGGGIQRLKVRGLLDGSTLDVTFKGNQTFDEVMLERKKGQFLYQDKIGFHFMDPISFEQCQFAAADKTKFLQEGKEYTILYLDNQPIDFELPIKIILKVVESPPGVKGDRAQAGTKQVILENGLVVTAPLHIKQGETVVVDTRSGAYVGKG